MWEDRRVAPPLSALELLINLPHTSRNPIILPIMRFKLLGNSGLRVSELALGTMTFGEQNADGVADKSVSRKLFDAFIEAGGNFIDTANDYTGGTSETHLGEFIASTGERDRFIVATKYTANMRPDDPNGGGNSRKSMVQSVEASLKRLQTDYIDLRSDR